MLNEKTHKIIFISLLLMLIFLKIFLTYTRPLMVADEFAHMNSAKYIQDNLRLDYSGKIIGGYRYANYPPLFHIILAGLTWLFPLMLARMIYAVAIGIGLFVLFYKIMAHFLDKDYALIVTALFSFNVVIFFWSSLFYTEGLVLFFVMLSIYMALKEKFVESTLAVSLCAMTKPYIMLFFLPFFFVSFIMKRDKRYLLPIIVIIPTYFIVYNMLIGYNTLYLTGAIKSATEFSPNLIIYFYLIAIQLGTLLFPMLFLKKKHIPLISIFLTLSTLYLAFNYILGIRWNFYILPFIFMLSAMGIYYFLKKTDFYTKNGNKIVFLLIIALILIVSSYQDRAVFSYSTNEQYYDSFLFFKGKTGNIFTPFQAEQQYYTPKMNITASLYYFYIGNSSNFNHIDYIWVSKIWTGEYKYWFPDVGHWFYPMIEGECWKPIFENNLSIIYEQRCKS